MLNKRYRLSIIVALLTVLSAGALIMFWPHKILERPTHTSQSIVIPKATAPLPTASSSLAIAALRAHATPGGKITVTQNLAARGGCITAIVAYPSDGLTLYALMEYPVTTAPAGGFPVVLVNHGYWPPKSWSTTGTLYQDYVNALCSAGNLVLRPDYRGNGSSPGVANGGDIYAEYTYDVLNLVHSVGSLTNANASKIALVGHSMGGAITLRAIVVDPTIKASVIVSGVTTSMQNIVYDWSPDPIPSDISAQVGAAVSLLGGTPTQSPTAWHDASALNYVSAINGPVQIDHGTADPVVPYAWSQQFDASLTAAHIPHSFISYPGADHFYSSSSDKSKLLTSITMFIAANDK